jgi:DNA-binding NarL/FixJ family response regulator
MLSRYSELEVVGEAADGPEVIELCRRLRPDLVLMDVRMPKMDGIAATREIKRGFPLTTVLMITAHEHLDYLSEALKSGAVGYVLKEATHRQVFGAIQKALSGEFPLDQRLSAQLLLRLIDEKKRGEKAAEENVTAATSGSPSEERPELLLSERLSPREVDVLRLLVQGETNQQIARKLFISTNTVKKHVRQIITKLKVSDRTQAAVHAVELGLLERRPPQA